MGHSFCPLFRENKLKSDIMPIKTTSRNMAERIKRYFISRKIATIASRDDEGNYTVWVCDSYENQNVILDAMIQNLGLVPKVQ